MLDTDLHIKLIFEKGFTGIDKGPFLLEVERLARKMLGVRAEVFMETMRDQNKPRQRLAKEDVI